MTEAGAVSAVAAFFRQNLDACAWAEEPSLPPIDNTAAPPGAPPLLRFPLHSKGTSWADGALHNTDSDGVAAPLELVVSRGPGPIFSEHEVCVARCASLLLSQALARVRDGAALSEAQSALEGSFRGMQEASDAVAVLVEERERRAQLEAQQGADLEDKHKEEVSAAENALERARREAEQLRRQLVAVDRSLTVVSEATGDVCRAVSPAVAACEPGDVAEGETGLSGEEANTGEVIAVIERAARNALQCSSTRVMRRCSANMEADPAAALSKGAREVEGLPAASAAMKDGCADDEEDGGESRSSAGHGDGETESVEQLHVPIPYHDDSSSTAESLVLSIRGVSNPLQRFSGRDRTAASALASCLGTALLALREKKEKWRILRHVEADQQAAAMSTAAAEAEAQERGERAVAGMRGLVATAQLSRAQAEAAASATRRAERHADALGHLLSGLDGGARNDHAAVARVVSCRASAVVPGCASAVLLTPRRHGGKEGAGTSPVSFSPDPRTWAAATAAATAASRKGRVVHGGSEKNGRRSKAFGGRQWAKRVGGAAAQAAATGKAVCLMSGNTADVSGGGGAGVGGGDGDFSRNRVVCFSPVPGVLSSERERPVNANDTSGRPSNSSSSICSDRMRTAELQGEEAIPGSVQTPCLIAWMLCLGASEEGRDVGRDPEAPWAGLSPLTEEGVSSIPAVVEPPPPPLLPPRVANAMEAVVHAVDIALSACRTAATAAAAHSSTVRRQPDCKRGQDYAEDAASKKQQLERSRRDEELRRLRDGTAALADRVRTLEGRAAGLRASEARSAAALVRARADAGVVRGELQFATLELERSRRKPLIAVRSAAENPSPGRGGDGGSRLSGSFRPFRGPSKPTDIIGSRLCGLTGSSSIHRAGEGGAGAGLGVPSTPAEANEASSGERRGNKAVQAALVSSNDNDAAFFASTVSLPPASSSPLPPPPGGASSSVALQHMASIHARLSSSLRSSRVSRTTPPPREGAGPVLFGEA